ncbi:protein-tyrosine phosphatase-like protein [Spinellus fusiger]|nr:protein-tyrosine phosphatase-like protein [Spinellus fusiger]
MSTLTYLKQQITFIHPPTYIEYNGKRFLIIDTPSNTSLPLYIEEFRRWHVTDVVRCCEATYSRDLLKERGIEVHDWVFLDGEAPSSRIVQDWLRLIEERFASPEELDFEKQLPGDMYHMPCIAAHCVAGLGRAPVLVAIALIELGMSPLDSIAYIRERRRGAINNRQIKYLEAYRPQTKSHCSIM